MSNLSIVFRIVRRRNIAKRWESSYAGHIIQKKKKTLKLWIFWIRNRKNQRKKKRKRGKKKEKNVELNIASVSIKKKNGRIRWSTSSDIFNSAAKCIVLENCYLVKMLNSIY